MSKKSLGVALILSALIAAEGPFAQDAGIPDSLSRAENPSGPPGWISEDAVREAMTRADRSSSQLEAVKSLFSEWESPFRELDRYTKNRSFTMTGEGDLESCDPEIVSYYMGERADSLERLIEMSSAISKVRIVGSRAGFRLGHAGQMLKAEVLDIYKDTGKEPIPRDSLFLFDRYARLAIDGKALCYGEKPVPQGEFYLFQIWTDGYFDLSLPDFFLDNSVLIAADGTAYGSLLDESVDSSQIAADLAARLAGKAGVAE